MVGPRHHPLAEINRKIRTHRCLSTHPAIITLRVQTIRKTFPTILAALVPKHQPIRTPRPVPLNNNLITRPERRFKARRGMVIRAMVLQRIQPWSINHRPQVPQRTHRNQLAAMVYLKPPT